MSETILVTVEKKVVFSKIRRNSAENTVSGVWIVLSVLFSSDFLSLLRKIYKAKVLYFYNRDKCRYIFQN